jgi:hypothetical protein
MVSYGTGVLQLADGRFLAASELSGVTETGPEHVVLVDVDGEAVGAWSGGGWWMAADPAGDRFYITSDKLRAHAVPAS